MKQEEREEEHQFLFEERKRNPELFQMEPMVDTPELLEWIGIKGVFGEYPRGHLKYLPQDFIVEEVSTSKEISTVDLGPVFQSAEGGGSTTYAELVKVGITTLQVRDDLARLLNIPSEGIATAGLKDEIAITSQKISLRKVREINALKNISEESFFVKNAVQGKDVLKRGQLWGNRFIITVRFQEPLSQAEKSRIKKSLQEIGEEGFWNFYSFQRFAAPRLNGHILGRHLLKGEHEEAVCNLLFFRGIREPKYFHNIREEAEQHWGDWNAIRELMKRFPSQFPTELQLLDHLVEHPQDVMGAFGAIAEQVRLWIYAYASYLFNKKLSQSIKTGEVALEFPFITSRDPRDQELYQEFLQEDGVRLSSRVYRDLPFLRTYWSGTAPTAPTLQKVEIHSVAFLDKMMVIAFSLPKGAYATTFLAHFFQLSSEAPLPLGLEITHIDAKEVLGLGSLKDIIERFHSVIKRIEKKGDALE